MRKGILRIVLTCFWGLGLFSVKAQQNLFNIPSGDITPGKKVFFQQQINVTTFQQYAAKSHLVYGLGKGWEVGFNALNMNVDFQKSPVFRTSAPPAQPTPFYPVGVLTAQKQWLLNDHFALNVGTQAGTNLSQSIQQKRFTHFTYALTQYHSHEKFKLIGGIYNTDREMVGEGNTTGIILGTEVHLSKRWLFMADYISGNNKNGVSVVGFTYNVTKQFQLCGGWQIPNARNAAELQAFVFEINLFNF
jgi:hypothetical protein